MSVYVIGFVGTVLVGVIGLGIAALLFMRRKSPKSFKARAR